MAIYQAFLSVCAICFFIVVSSIPIMASDRFGSTFDGVHCGTQNHIQDQLKKFSNQSSESLCKEVIRPWPPLWDSACYLRLEIIELFKRGEFFCGLDVRMPRLEGPDVDLALQELPSSLPKITKPDVEEQPDGLDQTTSGQLISASSGSGFAVSEDGYLVTNNHVIEGCQKIYVHRKGKKHQTNVVYYDRQNDLALLKGDFQPDAVLSLTSAKPQLAQDIYVSGYPFGMNVSSSVKVTKGIISSLTGIGNNLAEMQIDAALQSGNSGGPILDEYGNVVGVAVAKLDVKFALDNFGSIPENTNFGVKANIVEALLDANGVNYQQGETEKPSGAEFSNMLSNGTYYISCWMTLAQIEAMKTKKIMFSDLH